MSGSKFDLGVKKVKKLDLKMFLNYVIIFNLIQFQARTSYAVWQFVRSGVATGPSPSTSSTSTTPPGRRRRTRRRTPTLPVSFRPTSTS